MLAIGFASVGCCFDFSLVIYNSGYLRNMISFSTFIITFVILLWCLLICFACFKLVCLACLMLFVCLLDVDCFVLIVFPPCWLYLVLPLSGFTGLMLLLVLGFAVCFVVFGLMLWFVD